MTSVVAQRLSAGVRMSAAELARETGAPLPVIRAALADLCQAAEEEERKATNEHRDVLWSLWSDGEGKFKVVGTVPSFRAHFTS